MSKRKSTVLFTLMIVVMAIVGVLCFAKFPIGATKEYNSILDTINKGIDLSGGYYVVLTPVDSNGEQSSETIANAIEILRKRLDDKGYTEAVISEQDGNRIRVEIPQIDDDGSVLEVIGQTGKLTFKDGTGKEWLNGEDHIKDAYVAQDTQNGGFLVVLNFTSAGKSKFATATKTVYGSDDQKLYIYLGDSLVSSPSVSGEIVSDSAQIEGYSDYEEALSIASVIKSGRLPIEYTVSESRSISPKLGENALSSVLIMGAIALAVVFVIMLVRYRGLGIASDIALAIYVLLYIIFLAIIPNIQLTLPGIAGILLSIGMAVDANIVIFERIREEYAMNKTIETSVKQGFKHAVITVLDSNITTIFAAVVLWIICPGTIKGFAITLFIGIVLSLVASIFITRGIINLLLPMTDEEKQAKFFNLTREEGGLDK